MEVGSIASVKPSVSLLLHVGGDGGVQSQQQAMIAAANDLEQSGFGTVLLGQWHVHSDGSLYYNDSPLNTVTWAMRTIPSRLRRRVGTVPLTFGPAVSDFENIANNLDVFNPG